MLNMNSTPTNNSNLLPYPTIVAATAGDVDAINTVIRHYEGYIAVLCTRRFYDEYGNSYLCVDDEMRRRLETKLITKILSFSLA